MRLLLLWQIVVAGALVGCGAGIEEVELRARNQADVVHGHADVEQNADDTDDVDILQTDLPTKPLPEVPTEPPAGTPSTPKPPGGVANQDSPNPEPEPADPEPPSSDASTPPPPAPIPRLKVSDFLKPLLQGDLQRQALCGRRSQDKLFQAFCKANPPTIASLQDLQQALGLGFNNPRNTGTARNGTGGNPSFTLVGHSTSLVGRHVSAINPRALIFSPANNQNPDPDFVAMGYVRGDQFVEVAARDPASGALNFYLVTFKNPCDQQPSGCQPQHLLLPAVESQWSEVTVYGEQDLANTVGDCLQCHQPGGPQSAKILRMQELEFPWVHFFRNDTPEGQSLLRDFQKAHTTKEAYAGIPGGLIASSDPADLENLVRGNGFAIANLLYDNARIAREVNRTAGQPQSNAQPGASATWQNLYNRFVRTGRVITIPYHDAKAYDQAASDAMAAIYKATIGGSRDPAALPDIRQVLKDDPAVGFGIPADAAPAAILQQACRQCHHSQLDQSLSRARFNAEDPAALTSEQRLIAIERLKLPADDLKAMPPMIIKSLTPEQRQKVIEYLESGL